MSDTEEQRKWLQEVMRDQRYCLLTLPARGATGDRDVDDRPKRRVRGREVHMRTDEGGVRFVVYLAEAAGAVSHRRKGTLLLSSWGRTNTRRRGLESQWSASGTPV